MAVDWEQNGFTQVANDVLEALARTRISGEARQVLDTIIRKTWGFHKKSDNISLSQLTDATGLDKSNVIRARKVLVKMNIIRVNESRCQKRQRNTSNYMINRHFDTWKTLPKRKIVVKNDNASLSRTTHTKYTTTKDIIEEKAAKPPMGKKDSLKDLGWVVKAVTRLGSEFPKFAEAVRTRHNSDYWRLAGSLVKLGGCPSYVAFTSGRFYAKFKGSNGLGDPLAYLYEMLKPERACYECGDGLIWNERGTAEEYYRTFFEGAGQFS